MKQAILKKGIVYPAEIAAPNASEGNVLVKVVSSCISAGTEMSGVKSSGTNLIARALQQPDNVKKVIEAIKIDGIKKTLTRVRTKIEGGVPLGYSASGVVVEVGKGVEGLQVGDEVAIAGAGYANHAEYAEVPKNLVVRKPAAISFTQASTVALGAIAMQGVRRAGLTLGESCVVVGGGILGLMTIQMLRASGVRVCVSDLDQKRLEIAQALGAEKVISPTEVDLVADVTNWAGGHGVDCVIFTAATSSSAPLSDSFKMCRRKGTVVLVGVSGMEIQRSDIYTKELDFKISTSYGPGRYDASYEEAGHDYPYAYVRWTEQRNMAEYLRLLAVGAVKLEKLLHSEYPIEDVTAAYKSLENPDEKPLIVTLSYGPPSTPSATGIDRVVLSSQNIGRRIDRKTVNYALIGAGSFATGMHLPNMQSLGDKFALRAVCNRTGVKAETVAKQYDAAYSTTDVDKVLADEDIDMVLIATRHDSHGSLVLKALQAGKHVFVEKPLATNQEELDRIKAFYADGIKGKPILFVGFNRRFSKYIREIERHTSQRINPIFATYRMNAGFAPSDSWIHQDGGRIVGEGCHIVDLMNFITGGRIKSIATQSLKPKNNHFKESDNKSITLKYDDGSVCVINYFAVGNKALSKEMLEVHFDGKSIVMDDYRSLKGYGVKITELSGKSSEKGQLEELGYLHDSIIGKSSRWPIELGDLLQATEATLIVAEDRG